MKYMVRLRWGGLLSFGLNPFTDEKNAKEWAEKMKGVVVPFGEPESESKKTPSRKGKR